MILIEFQGPSMSEKQREEFLGSIIETGAHVDAAEVDPSGRGRIEFHTNDMEFGEFVRSGAGSSNNPMLRTSHCRSRQIRDAPA